MARFEIQHGDDWVVILKDGERIYAGHGPSLHDMAEIIRDLGHHVTHHSGQFGELDEYGIAIGDGDDTVFTIDH